MSSILFPLRTNIKSLQRWGDAYDISGRIKQSMILYDEIILEAGTFTYRASGRFVHYDLMAWSEDNTTQDVLKTIEELETASEDGCIAAIDGKTGAEKLRYRIRKKDDFVADFRTVDVISEVESGSYGRERDFLKYAYILRKENHKETIGQNVSNDLAHKETVKKIHDKMYLVGLLYNLNDSLALSHSFKMPIALDVLHTPLLRFKRDYGLTQEFRILDRLAQIGIPDFGVLDLDRLLQLRKDNAIRAFRKMIWQISSKLQSQAEYDIDKLFVEELLNEIREMAPSKKGFAVNAALGALSAIPVPLVSVATAILDVGKELKEYSDFSTNWLSFILKAKELDRD